MNTKSIYGRNKPDLYELYGILMGDGCISRYHNQGRIRYEIRVDGNAVTDEAYYYLYLVPLISRVVGKNHPTVRFRKQCSGVYVRFLKKEFALFLNESFGFPFGKKGDIKIKEEIVEDFSKARYVLRGIFDTDGSIYFTKNNSKVRNYPIIEITTYSPILLSQLMKLLVSADFLVRINHRKDSVKLHGKENLLKWMKLIGTSHPDKRSKFDFWRKYGYCPALKEMTIEERTDLLGL